MHRKLLALLTVLLLFSAVSSVHAQDWVSGTVSTVPSAVTYGGAPHFQFDFAVQDTNGTETGTISCVIPYALALSSWSYINLGASQNMTGDIASNGTVPFGSFLISGFIVTGNDSLTLEGALRWFWGILGGLGNVLVSELQYFVLNSLHIEVPTAVMNTALLVALAVVWWYGRRLPWFVSIVMFVVCIGLASNLITTMQMGGGI